MAQAPPDFSRLPVTFSEGVSFPVYCLISCIGVAHVLGGLALFLTASKGLFLILFGAAFIWGANRYGPRIVKIDRAGVEAKDRRLLSYGKSWAEPLSAFRGVALAEPREEDAHFSVELQHENKRKSVVLYNGDAETSTKIRNDAARDLNMPVVEGGGVTSVIRPAEDIDIPLGQPRRRASLHTAFDRAASKPRGISWRIEEGELRINIRVLPFSVLSRVTWTTIYTLLAAVFWQAWLALGFIFLIVAGLVAGTTVVTIIRCLVGRRRIEIGDTEVRFFWGFGPFQFGRRNMLRSQIISVETHPSTRRRDDVLITAPDSTVRVRNLKRKTAAWLVNFLQAAIVRGPTAVT